MKSAFKLCLLPLLSAPLAAQRPWQTITVPTVADAAANFATPPHEYGAIQPFARWNGADPAEVRSRIVRDLDRRSANGIFVVNLSPGRRVPGEGKYLSPEHMDQVKFTVAEAAKRNMRLWIQDESDYPSGFAGGYISERYPQIGMQDIVADITVRVQPGQTLQMPVPADTLAILAQEFDAAQQLKQTIPIPVPADHQLKWLTPAEGSTPNEPRATWQVLFVRHVYLSSPTRNFNRADGTRAKDAAYSLIDYLDPAATQTFLSIVHETYRAAVGSEFGKTVLGFFGDEPDYSSGIPWTPTLLTQFQAQKGYDLTPYIATWFGHQPPTEASERARADYYDVWSGIFRSSFFGEQAKWAANYNVEYLVHLNHEENMPALERSGGDFFRDMRSVQVPGIDNLSQLIPSAVHKPDGVWTVNNNFPKLASSAAHLFGHPQVWSEEGGGTGVDGKYQLDYQLVRGVNALQIRVPGLQPGGGEASAGAPQEIAPQASMIAWYANRGGYLMAIGRPAAQVALYHPGNSIWLGGDAAQEADRSTTKLGWQLLEHQVDWDYIDEQSLSSVATLEGGAFKNLSGQSYRAIILPSMTVITRASLDRLHAFATQGGKVIFVGKTPTLVIDKTFLDAKQAPDLSFVTLVEKSGDITPAVLAALPARDVKLDAPFPRLTYTHRAWADGEMYYFFNESNQVESRMATIVSPAGGHGKAQAWVLGTGEIHPMSDATSAGDAVTFPLVLAPYEAKVVVVGPLPAKTAAPEPGFSNGLTVEVLDGDWSLDLNGKQTTTALKSWEELGTSGFTGPATYKKQFNLTVLPGKRHVYLEIARVNDYAKVKLNGKDLGAHAWQPYRWDATGALKTGANELVIEVDTTLPARVAVGGGALPTVKAESGVLGAVRLVAY